MDFETITQTFILRYYKLILRKSVKSVNMLQLGHDFPPSRILNQHFVQKT